MSTVSGELEYNEWQTETGEKRTTAVINVKTLYCLINPKLQCKREINPIFQNLI